VAEDGTYLDVLSMNNDQLLYLPREEIVGKRIAEIFPKEYADLFMSATKEAIEKGELQIIEYSMSVGGEKRYFEARIMPTDLKEGGKRTTVSIVRDMTAAKRSIDYLHMIKKIFEDATEGIFITSSDGTFVEANEAFYHIMGLRKNRLPGIKLSDFQSWLDPETYQRVSESLGRDGFFHGEVQLRGGPEGDKLVWLTIDTIYNDQGEAEYRVAMLTDISELQKSRERLRFTATHDMLTGLPNRALLFERLDEAVNRSIRSGMGGALLFIDLDNFKEVNDAFCIMYASDSPLSSATIMNVSSLEKES
jgi:PAS domain S-box-containing protein